MSLDSIELLIEWEKAFAISIPDLEAENIVTVSDATEVILRQVALSPASHCKSQRLFYQFRTYFEQTFHIPKEKFLPSATIINVFPPTDTLWDTIEADTGWLVPKVHKDERPSEFRFMGITWGESKQPVAPYTIRHFIDYVFALNYTKLISLPVVCNRYEIEKAIMGITAHYLGVPIHRIRLDTRFVDDLGLD